MTEEEIIHASDLRIWLFLQSAVCNDATVHAVFSFGQNTGRWSHERTLGVIAALQTVAVAQVRKKFADHLSECAPRPLWAGDRCFVPSNYRVVRPWEKFLLWLGCRWG